MVSWREFRSLEPALAEQTRARFDAHRHKTMATLRADGSPRISGIEVVLDEGEVWLGGMPGSIKFRDLRRDPRVALHSGSDEPEQWRGDAKLAGTAIEVFDSATLSAFAEGQEVPPGDFELFRVDLTEVVTVSLAASGDHLVVASWHTGRGVQRVERR